MKIRLVVACTGAVAALSACGGGLMPSEYAYLNTTPDTVESWLGECEGNDNDMLRKARYCELADKSIGAGDAD